MKTEHIPLSSWNKMEGYKKEGFDFEFVSLDNLIINKITYRIFPMTRFIIDNFIVKFGEVANFKTKWNEHVTKVVE